MEITASIQQLKGVGEKTAQRFQGLNIASVEDLLRYFPRDYLSYDPPVAIKALEEAEGMITVAGHIQSRPAVRYGNRMKITTVMIRDQDGALQLLWFNMPFLANSLRPGSYYLFRGRIQIKGSRLCMVQPEIYTPAAYEEKMHGLQPMYALTKGITNHLITKTVKQAFASVERLPERLPEQICGRYGLMGTAEALRIIHFPQNAEELKQARRRLVFEEFFFFLLAMEAHKQALDQAENGFVMKPDQNIQRFVEALPYELTEDQKKAWQDMQRDFAGKRCMHRMLQGDVGSGKTILAVLGCFTAAANGFQSVIMAPTEVLAKQHYDSVMGMLEANQLPYRAGLLTGSLPAAQKRRIQERIALGLIDIVVGTHALIQDQVNYQDLAFVVTDEQHRFGVKQREALSQKGSSPHVLVMSATPIPRTLALLLYGDLDISVLRQMPKDRLPVQNCVIGQDKRNTAYRFIMKEIMAGHQAYVICPMVEESELLEGENVIDYAGRLREVFPENVSIGILHGRMKPAMKNQIMERFSAGDLDILVSTTVIEVGIDVPNATVMMIETADRFGLSQLHQLRGRVGRGKQASYCIFVSGSRKQQTRERLDILNHTNDGFEIAEKDLELRGPGELFGIRQSGALEFRIGDIIGDSGILYEAKKAVEEVLQLDPGLETSENRCIKNFLQHLDENWNL